LKRRDGGTIFIKRAPTVDGLPAACYNDEQLQTFGQVYSFTYGWTFIMVTILPIDTIVSDTSIRDGQPIIAGTQIRVSDIVASHLYRGLQPDELAVNFKLSLGQVYAALAYYYQRKDQIDELMQQEQRRASDYLEKLASDERLIRIG
jgi:uncharacterized protein (DUF433 family)